MHTIRTKQTPYLDPFSSKVKFLLHIKPQTDNIITTIITKCEAKAFSQTRQPFATLNGLHTTLQIKNDRYNTDVDNIQKSILCCGGV